MMTNSTLLIAIVGPTASGKSDLAVRLARQLRGEIVNCDSLQMYRYLDIGTAKPSQEVRKEIPHHLFDFLEPDAVFSAGEYSRRARIILGEISTRSNLPIVVGGTGFYLRALIDGLFTTPGRDYELRRRLQGREKAKGSGYIHRILNHLDPVAAANIHANDLPKVIRAIEVCMLAGKPISKMYEQGRNKLEGFKIVKIGLNPNREKLRDKIDQRTVQMFGNGLIEETSDILDRGFPSTCAPFQSIGYRQALDYLLGRISRKDAIRYAQAATRQYAKRQMTWFRKDTTVKWFHGFGSDPQLQADVLDTLKLLCTSI
ncbi:MAG: tRNA (adenosine(37)-N6)-dimethylallyltransferase MiaA [Acidobacteria bacterium RIFCSPLOWO2_12_FULL_54_10]|nr:MAG: tRNA (adenosine(37)-N6)-dimethylallyltransferase MiaA [Acidobacteria bacterium RIFCSPLOWO2_12_FULL_54_10]